MVLQSGYWQVNIADKEKVKKAFIANDELQQFKVTPFGLCNALAIFERLMERVLDDMIVMAKLLTNTSRTWEKFCNE